MRRSWRFDASTTHHVGVTITNKDISIVIVHSPWQNFILERFGRVLLNTRFRVFRLEVATVHLVGRQTDFVVFIGELDAEESDIHSKLCYNMFQN